MSVVKWQEKIDATFGKKPVDKGGMVGVYFEDYQLDDGYWRYTWTNFTLEQNPDFVEVYKMDND